MSMRWVVYSGWLMIALGAAMLAGAIAAGEPLYGAGMLVALAGPGALDGALGLRLGQSRSRPLTICYQWGRPANATVLAASPNRRSTRAGVRSAKLKSAHHAA